MAQTDTRPGFRLPWSSDRAEADAAAPAADTDTVTAEPAVESALEASSTTDVDRTPTASADAEADTSDQLIGEATALDAWPGTRDGTIAEITPTVEAVPEPAVIVPGKRPSKFLADLTKAMRATAEAARGETMERFSADAKAAAERVHAAAAEEATELRRVSDEDVAGIRDWSKAEIARIRETTESRISSRKADLERELELHGGTIEGRVERVSAFVAAFEAEITAFYDRLFAEEDPTRFAAMAEQLPEAPSLDLAELDGAALIGRPTPVAEPELVAETEAVAETVVVADTADAPEATVEAVETPADATIEPEAVAETGDSTAGAETSTTDSTEPVAEAIEPTLTGGPDPRIEALGLGVSDFATAEAEAAVAADAAEAARPSPEVDEIPLIADEVLAARIAGLVPDETNSPNPLVTTKVIVSGLVSVASIAGFKRHLSRLQGVTTVGVSSGPDGEFVFSVHHLPTVDLAAGITSLPGFDTRITGQDDGTVTVTARDPESHD